MNERIKQLWDDAALMAGDESKPWDGQVAFMALFAELIIRECIDKIETYRIPVGNSRSGELACEWTYNALKDIRDEIKETFGV